ncbi:MAG: ATP-binding protein [Burkholderiales bacterium]|nr:ATP-binding protein [Pseudomonadota bacterium]
MKLLPRSLLTRTVLLIALLLTVSQLAWFQMLRLFEREPRARQLAVQVVSTVNLTRAALLTAEPSKRRELLLDLSEREGIRVYTGLPAEIMVNPPNSRFLQLTANAVGSELGMDTQVLVQREDDGTTLWVSFNIEGDEYWIVLSRARTERAFPTQWLSWGALVLLFSIFGAYLIVSRINRPLRRLTDAAARIGKGELPPALPETGSTEIRAVSRGFNQMTDDLKRLEADRALLLAGVSHDLRTPLSRLRLELEMLNESESLKTGMAQDIDEIDAIIDQFLAFARGNAEETEAECDLNAIVRAVRERYARIGKPMVLDLADLPPLALKPLAIQRLLVNLVENALRHGGGAIEIRTAVNRDNAVLAVLDRGLGIPECETGRMLQPFTRMDSARSGGGSGLGLAIVDRIARLHEGSVKLLARAGGGLEARVELPLRGEPHASDQHPESSA